MGEIFGEIETITSGDKIKEIFDSSFAGKPAYLSYSERDVRVKCYSCIKGKMMIGIPFAKVSPEPVILYTSIGNKMIHFYLKKSGRAGGDITVFDVIKCCRMVSARGATRYQISNEKNNRNDAFITGFINETILENSLQSENKKISSIFTYAELELKKHFSNVKFITKNESPQDQKMQYILNTQAGLIIRKINDDNPEDRDAYDFYMKNIYAKENSAKSVKLSFSEAVLPLCYRDKIPYGYLRVNKESTMSDTDLTFAQNFVKSIEQYLFKMQIFPVVTDKIIVHEVSSKGLSILHHDKKNLRYFKIGNQFCCDLVFPENKKVNLLGRIKHNSSGDAGIIRTGFEIEKIDDNYIDDFRGYIGSFEQRK